MPKQPPPDALPGEPTRAVLRAGTPLFRVHASHRDPAAYNSSPSHAFYFGGRFDSTPYDRYGYLYVGFTPGAAVCEVLLRSLAFPGDGGARLLPRKSFERRSLSFLSSAEDIEVVSLMSGADLSALAQDPWLVQTEGEDYPQTRDWGHWIRARTKPWAQGLVWPSKREPAERVAVLFDDRGHGPALEPTGAPPIDFGTAEGERWLNGVLTPYLARTAPRLPGRDD
ncbi:RES family NAD+ phosphorylase [Streptomyces sp. NPDC101178]|uniref:RES family NAD+ phosphorylase n=1 Tax=Streptomyces sp. NPDC101178 TaxID=3366124 RepID=UPI0038308786